MKVWVFLLFVTTTPLLSGCGGSSDSGAGDTTTPPATNPDQPTDQPADGDPSNDEPASGFYDGTIAINTTGGGRDFTVRLRVVIDPGGGVAVEETDILRAQARMNGSEFVAEASGRTESLFGMTCTADRRYDATVVGTNASVQGQYTGVFNCSDGSNLMLSGAFNLPRTGDHQ